MKRVLILSLLTMVLFSSCVSKKKYEQALGNYQQCLSDVAERDREIATLRERSLGGGEQINLLKDQIATLDKSKSQLQSTLDDCLAQSNKGQVNINNLINEINASNKYIQQLVNSKNRSDSLNMVLTNNLTRSLTNSEKGDIDIKVQKGVVFISLSDNMLYNSGSYQISERAQESLAKIAKVINDYPDYDVMVEGNTDNVPISKTNIRNNWDLSALRASSVVQALQKDYGVDPKRMTAGGRGEYNPLTSNDNVSGRNRNRRTEIIILPKLEEFMELIGQAPEPTN